MIAEGWGGYSIREHVESAAASASEALSEAARALHEAEGIEDNLRALTGQVDALAQRIDDLSEGRGLAESAHDEIASLRAELGELAAKVNGGAALPSDRGQE